ncbi:MAG: 6-carboxytetrahydropterin synthase [Bacteroidales bacterium]|nr:6-carboxytetrahydropterin synthase [Bacteroidales bacterium]
MTKIRLTKEFRFEASHALWHYDGLCKNIHGHSYILQVTVIGEPNKNEGNPKLGMVMDFGDLKKIVKEEIVDSFDHSVILNGKAPHQDFTKVDEMFDRIHVLDYQPTCENMVEDFANKIKARLPKDVSLFSIKLYETATSYAEWYAEDNQH